MQRTNFNYTLKYVFRSQTYRWSQLFEYLRIKWSSVKSHWRGRTETVTQPPWGMKLEKPMSPRKTGGETQKPGTEDEKNKHVAPHKGRRVYGQGRMVPGLKQTDGILWKAMTMEGVSVECTIREIFQDGTHFSP